MIDQFREFLEADADYHMLLEMARPRKDGSNVVPLDKYDDAYLKKFPRDKSAIKQALRYRYGPNVLQRPDAGVQRHTVTINLDGRKREVLVPIDHGQIMEKFNQKGYNPLTWPGLGITGAAMLADRYLAYLGGKSKDRGGITLDQEGIARQKEALKQHYIQQRADFRDNPPTRQSPVAVTLTPEDERYLTPFPARLKKTALALRYSDYYFNHPEYRGKNIVSVTMSAPGQGNGVRIDNVPLFFGDLRKRWEELKLQGWDFQVKPLTGSAAAKLIAGGTHIANYNARGGEINPDQDQHQKYSDLQDLHLSDPDKYPSPNVPAEGSDRDRRQPWQNLLAHDAEIAYQKAVSLLASRGYRFLMKDQRFLNMLAAHKKNLVASAVSGIRDRFSGHDSYGNERFRIGQMASIITRGIAGLRNGQLSDRMAATPAARMDMPSSARVGANSSRTPVYN